MKFLTFLALFIAMLFFFHKSQSEETGSQKMEEQSPKIGSGFKEGFGFALGYKLGDRLFSKETSGCLLKTIVVFIVILALFLMVRRC